MTPAACSLFNNGGKPPRLARPTKRPVSRASQSSATLTFPDGQKAVYGPPRPKEALHDMKNYSPDWPSQSIMASAKFKIKPIRQHWSWDSVAAKALAQEKREPRKRLSAAELQARADAKLMARLQEILKA